MYAIVGNDRISGSAVDPTAETVSTAREIVFQNAVVDFQVCSVTIYRSSLECAVAIESTGNKFRAAVGNIDSASFIPGEIIGENAVFKDGAGILNMYRAAVVALAIFNGDAINHSLAGFAGMKIECPAVVPAVDYNLPRSGFGNKADVPPSEVQIFIVVPGIYSRRNHYRIAGNRSIYSTLNVIKSLVLPDINCGPTCSARYK